MSNTLRAHELRVETTQNRLECMHVEESVEKEKLRAWRGCVGSGGERQRR